MNFQDILKKIREESLTERGKGYEFEKLMRDWLRADRRYSDLEKVWMWSDFPCRDSFGGKDVGIDLVAKTQWGQYWAIQCKCYTEGTTLDKPAVDSFLATSSRSFTDPESGEKLQFSNRLWISTTEQWGPNAEEAIQNQEPPVNRVGLRDLEESSVDWDKLLSGFEGKQALVSEKKGLFPHQKKAVQEAAAHFKDNDRGKLIMACGTGKTFTALKIAENLIGEKGLILFMVPSIALLNQTLNAWAIDSEGDIKAVCICSDIKASRKIWEDNPDSSVDLALPATTNPVAIKERLLRYRAHKGLVVVFSTYQSVDAVSEAQKKLLLETNGEYGEFDLIICDEAHRTTGVKLSTEDESEFTKIHDNKNVRGKKRLYMTATPRIYGQGAKVKASLRDCVLCSMDDEKLYGREFHRLNFSNAVKNGLLTDYKVLVLTVNEDSIPANILRDVKNGDKKELNYDDTSKLIGVINGLSKKIRGDDGKTWEVDPRMMRRAVAFCSQIGNELKPGTSKNTASVLPKVSEQYNKILNDQEKAHSVRIQAKHIDGTMNAVARNEIISWLKEEPEDKRECRIVSNVRCLSEGVDVPALDAVIFLSSRNSHIDVVQSVGRVMRNFRKGQEGEKKYGYIIIPVVIPPGIPAKDALDSNEAYSVIWEILNALRAHDDHFNAYVNQIDLNKDKSGKVLIGAPGFSVGQDALSDSQDQRDARILENAEIAQKLNNFFGELTDGLYARLVLNCGERLYWENWAKEVSQIAQKFIERIKKLVVNEGKHRKEFEEYLEGLRDNLNPSIDETQAIEMLAQHLITRPVFDALFEDYEFVKNNTVSRSIQEMVNLLQEEAFDKDTAVLHNFYERVKVNVGKIDNLAGKQTIIKNLYEKFFKGAFPLTVEKLGIVYTPVECVDFMLHSVEDILKKEFNCSISDENVHILDPFVGTGTFITRLLQSGLIRPEDMERKYRDEIHCNELVLLAYYIADVNIESVFHEVTGRKEYLRYEGICLTDTFNLNEHGENDIFSLLFKENSDRLNKQKNAPVRVIIANPPYSIGQKSANDNAQNLKYPKLDSRIEETYVVNSKANLRRGLYDSYIKAFRWASDRISAHDKGGVIAFISNGAWLDGLGHDGFRKCLEEEFSGIYVMNLRGNCRTSGEMRRKEGDGVFGLGSRTPICMTLLVKKPEHHGKAKIHYYDIGDYLSHEEKLKRIKNFRSIRSEKIEWKAIHPNEKQDWINQRDGLFDTLLPLFPPKKFDLNAHSFFSTYSLGMATNRDPWVYNSSLRVVTDNMQRMIAFYNEQQKAYSNATSNNNSLKVEDFIDRDSKKISWTVNLKNDLENGVVHKKDQKDTRVVMYRPFYQQCIYFDVNFIERPGQSKKFFPTPRHENRVICVHGVGGKKEFSALMTDCIPDLQMLFNGQCFPLYWYEEKDTAEPMLFEMGTEEKYSRKEGVTDWVLKEVCSRYGVKKGTLTKEHIFYYVYGLLHSAQYRERFADDLRKSLPKIPIVEKLEDFLEFRKKGKELADLHLDYEKQEPCPGVQVIGDRKPEDEYKFYRVEKMRFPAKEQKDTIIYNGELRIENIPARAYQYVVNGRSAIEWIMERYQVTVDKESQIKNDPNDWSREHGQPRYILDLLLSVIHLSVKSVEIMESLPKLNFEEAHSTADNAD